MCREEVCVDEAEEGGKGVGTESRVSGFGWGGYVEFCGGYKQEEVRRGRGGGEGAVGGEEGEGEGKSEIDEEVEGNGEAAVRGVGDGGPGKKGAGVGESLEAGRDEVSEGHGDDIGRCLYNCIDVTIRRSTAMSVEDGVVIIICPSGGQ